MGCSMTPRSLNLRLVPWLIPDSILARLQRLVVRARGVIVVFAYIITPLAASAQIVESDVTRWSE